MERTASLPIQDLSLSPCLFTPGTNHGSVHSLGAVDQKKKKKKDLHFILNVPLKQLMEELTKERTSHTIYQLLIVKGVQI